MHWLGEYEFDSAISYVVFYLCDLRVLYLLKRKHTVVVNLVNRK